MTVLFLEKSKVEEILCILDEEGCIFPGFEIVKVNNIPCLLGTGGFSRVYEMNCFEKPEEKYVLKVMGFEKHIMTSENFWDTVSLQYSLSEHTPYICRLIAAREIRIVLDEEGNLREVTDVEGELWEEDGLRIQFILMEQLEDIVNKNRFGKVSLLRSDLQEEEGVIDLAIQIGQALYYAHDNNVLHRDVKMENIFWDETSGGYKLGDFGIAKHVIEGNAQTVVYTDGYGAPEIERRLYDSYNATADIYSFGITLYLLLNDFRFPGSEGYYVNMVQYNPEFIFPAPANASVGMVRIIRKMCQYNQEERYQSMSEILMDLSVLKSRKQKITDDEDIELPDFETETYREDKESGYINSGELKKSEVVSRAERKEYERIYNKIYNTTSIWYFTGFTLLMVLLMRGLQDNSSVVYQWQFFILPVMVLVETILLRVKEIHILFGGLTIAVGIYLCVILGISVPYVIMLIGVATGIPVVTGASVLSTVLWVLLIETGKLQWLNIIREFDLCWILQAVLIHVLYHYVLLRIILDKSTGIRADIEMFIYEKIHFAIIAAGLILLTMEYFSVIKIPEIVEKIHLVRTGLAVFVTWIVYRIKEWRYRRRKEE